MLGSGELNIEARIGVRADILELGGELSLIGDPLRGD